MSPQGSDSYTPTPQHPNTPTPQHPHSPTPMVTLQLRQLDVPPGQRLLLHDVSWAEFEAILADLGDHRRTRIAYDHGLLEIMTPLPEHEYFKQSISIAIEDIAEVLEQDYESYGSTTWKQQAQQAGLEPDNCFYFQNEALVRGKLTFDLDQDPPPDLALEIDITSKSLNRFPIYARLGIPEVWCYDQGALHIYLLQGDRYIESQQSQVFPALKIPALPALIEQYRGQGRLALRRAVRQWVRGQLP
ncbi:Uma2 family endonuclease [Leptolyngbya sp. PCC 6406]|uniref:Uma2 family endonuclease n=1 Tax=Leptolyngbya sp. PCC 6406 TaxID=1173264 RepID=UPI00272B30A3|nr:Uma2 family endonuclease [Leptolyngbya sp. PCC 6406]